MGTLLTSVHFLNWQTWKNEEEFLSANNWYMGKVFGKRTFCIFNGTWFYTLCLWLSKLSIEFSEGIKMQMTKWSAVKCSSRANHLNGVYLRDAKEVVSSFCWGGYLKCMAQEIMGIYI